MDQKLLTNMNIVYKKLLEDFLAYFVPGVKIAGTPYSVVILGDFYKNYRDIGSLGWDYERFEFGIQGTIESTCKEILKKVISDAMDEGFKYYPAGTEWGIVQKGICLYDVEDIEDQSLRERLLGSGLDVTRDPVDISEIECEALSFN